MFAATRVMAAGKAGLESLPYFVDELLAQGITQLAPWAVDHSTEQIEELREATREKRAGPWQKVYENGAGEPGSIMRPEMVASQRLLKRINPLASDTGLADSPAQLAAWCRLNIWQYCRDTVSLWDRFKHENGITEGQQLAVVIPFCPEGPTSGTVGMYLGAALRKQFTGAGRESELVVWGIELCPPVDFDEAGRLNTLAVQNAFRGYVARRELLQGVPLTEDEEDDDLWAPFDITIAFDGGTTRVVTRSRQEIWKDLDRAAAQTTACLLNGAAGGDVAESTNWLKQGKRWNAYLAHVVSEHSYSTACRYLRYRVHLPWNRNPVAWERESLPQQKEAFLRRIDNEVRPLLASEEDDFVKEKIALTLEQADRVKAIKSGFFKNRNNEVQQILNDVVADEQGWYEQACKDDTAPDRVIPKTDPFCINVALHESARLESAIRMRDSGSHNPPIAGVLGTSGTIVRDRIESLFEQVLKRSDCQSMEVDSQALFEEIIAISIDDRSRSSNNGEFQPAREFLLDFIGSESRDVPGSYNPLSYDLGDKVQPPELSKALQWRVKKKDKEKEFFVDLPVEFSFLTLARCRREDGFRDVSTYDELRKQHDDLIGNLDRWRDYARYYGIKPPPELLDDGSESPNNSSVNPMEPEPEPNGQRPAAMWPSPPTG